MTFSAINLSDQAHDRYGEFHRATAGGRVDSIAGGFWTLWRVS